MTLPDFLIQLLGKRGYIKPFVARQVNPASYDMALGGHIIDLNTDKEHELQHGQSWLLEPEQPILATTKCYVSIPSWCSATVYLKSSAARKGLDHALAGWVDPGFHGQLTLEFHAHKPVQIEVGKCYVQLVYNLMLLPPMRSYRKTGRYNGQRGATRAR